MFDLTRLFAVTARSHVFYLRPPGAPPAVEQYFEPRAVKIRHLDGERYNGWVVYDVDDARFVELRADRRRTRRFASASAALDALRDYADEQSLIIHAEPYVVNVHANHDRPIKWCLTQTATNTELLALAARGYAFIMHTADQSDATTYHLSVGSGFDHGTYAWYASSSPSNADNWLCGDDHHIGLMTEPTIFQHGKVEYQGERRWVTSAWAYRYACAEDAVEAILAYADAHGLLIKYHTALVSFQRRPQTGELS